MREIKFRAFYKNKIRDVVSIDWRNEFCSLAKGFVEIPLKDINLMQYTGLDDVNGKPIYEGDIVKAYRTCKSDLITFGNGSFGIALDDWHSFESFTDFYGKCEVIGNKFQNPELLEAE